MYNSYPTRLYAESYSVHFISEWAVHMCNDDSPGLFINESMPNAHMSLYADDVAMVNDTKGQLQR